MAKKKSNDSLTIDEKLQMLEDLNVFHNKPNSDNFKVTKLYKGQEFSFEMELYEKGSRVYQVNRKKGEIPVEYIWGTPKRKSYVEALHEALDKCLEYHQTLVNGEKPESEEIVELSGPEDLDFKE